MAHLHRLTLTSLLNLSEGICFWELNLSISAKIYISLVAKWFGGELTGYHREWSTHRKLLNSLKSQENT